MTNTIERFARPINEQRNVNFARTAFMATLEAEHLDGFDLQVPGLEVEVGENNNPFNLDPSSNGKHRYTWES